MTKQVKHPFASPITDTGDPNLVGPNEWNADHDVTIDHSELGTIGANDHHNQDHQARHNSGGADALKLDDLAAPDDTTDLDASTAKHGLLKKLPGGTTTYLRADGSFATPPGTGGLSHAQKAALTDLARRMYR